VSLPPVNRRSYQKNPLFLWTLVGFLLWSGTAWSETSETGALPALSASVERKTAKIGDILWVTLTYALPENTQLPKSGGMGGFETLTVIEQKAEPNKIKFRFLVDQLDSFELGPFSLTYLDSQENEHQLATEPVAITVLSNLGDKPGDATLKPIQDIISTQSRWLPYLIWIFAATILIGMISGFVWWRKKRVAPRMRAAMEDPPHVKADKEIDKLIASGLFENGNVKAFYFIFSETIRRYMESIRRFPAAEMTTEEIAKILKKDPSDQIILPLLRQADLVKFADSMPAPDRKDQDIMTARTYIQQTRPRTNSVQKDPSIEEVRQ